MCILHSQLQRSYFNSINVILITCSVYEKLSPCASAFTIMDLMCSYQIVTEIEVAGIQLPTIYVLCRSCFDYLFFLNVRNVDINIKYNNYAFSEAYISVYTKTDL